jgi:hypothetical protein
MRHDHVSTVWSAASPGIDWGEVIFEERLFHGEMLQFKT